MPTIAQINVERMTLAKHDAALGTFRGYPIAELRTIFEKIQHPDNWKNQLGGIIPLADFAKATIAAAFFAGSRLDLIYSEPEEFGPDRKCYVSGPGYYRSVGA